MPLRYCFPPHPVGFVPRSYLKDYIKGNDPYTGKPLMQEFIDRLTKPLTEERHLPVANVRDESLSKQYHKIINAAYTAEKNGICGEIRKRGSSK